MVHEEVYSGWVRTPGPLHLVSDQYISHASLFPFLSDLTFPARATMYIDCILTHLVPSG
ncbi:hypothetical protein ASPSYDRAFT_38446 [Aspergillus sydowii CBS 593.65]|uniref:Uncharacterized protein n=1 Tax=Aspergillus sydowii CBS 593.65 TaxID=1036612 RepID=A0A1L9TWJ1_9EURO|nr:uncharacterized protein ASPSYDRAFT_38446 [Aspergillus sydowii CBS 593.65]OJJ63786.1 hypothetical protein ASPSYDRAFT_38446 [Aspergillus sydowii CBS 593.65]